MSEYLEASTISTCVDTERAGGASPSETDTECGGRMWARAFHLLCAGRVRPLYTVCLPLASIILSLGTWFRHCFVPPKFQKGKLRRAHEGRIPSPRARRYRR